MLSLPAADPGSALAAALKGGSCPPQPGSLLGLEHEYSLSILGKPVDFRELIHSLPVPGLRLDPGDRNAYRLASGLVLTCDEAEAEIATPPLPVRPGVTRDLLAWASHGEETVRALLPSDIDLAGYSTHISIALEPGTEDAVAELYAETFGPMFSLFLESPHSLGIYIRPHPGRLELCADFARGAQLAAAAVFAVASTRVCAAAIADPRVNLPRALAVGLLPGRERYGFRLTRYASGLDLYALARGAMLTQRDGGTTTASDYLRESWRCARPFANELARDERHHVDDIVVGRRRLGVEGQDPAIQPSLSPPEPSPYGRILRTRPPHGITVEPVAATWQFTLLRLESRGRTAIVCVPAAATGEFVRCVTRGRLDLPLRNGLAVEPTRQLTRPEQTQQPGFYASAPDLAALLPRERPPLGAALPAASGRSAKVSPSTARAGKTSVRPWKVAIPSPQVESSAEQLPLPARPSPSGRGWAPGHRAVAAVLGAVGLVAMGAAIVFGLAESGGASPVPTPTAAQTSATVGAPTVVSTVTPGGSAAAPVGVATLAGTKTPGVDAAALTVTPPNTPTATATAVRAVPTAPVESATAVTSPTPLPTETRAPTPAATATATARPTATPRSTSTPTPHPPATPTPTVIIVIPPLPTPVALCTPQPGGTCP